MRDIRFRAWQKHHKEMFEVAAIQLREPNFVVKKSVSGFNLETWTLDEVELMQYTGLLDKNGKEIYEGDIVTSHTPFDHWNDNVNLVKYEEGTWNYSYAIQEFSDHPERQWEIIGNIYEHPELLAGTSNEKEQP